MTLLPVDVEIYMNMTCLFSNDMNESSKLNCIFPACFLPRPSCSILCAVVLGKWPGQSQSSCPPHLSLEFRVLCIY